MGFSKAISFDFLGFYHLPFKLNLKKWVKTIEGLLALKQAFLKMDFVGIFLNLLCFICKINLLP